MAREREDGQEEERAHAAPKRRRLLADLPGAPVPPSAPPPPPSAAAAAAPADDQHDDDDDDDPVLSDVEAALLLLRDQLYGAPLQQQQERNQQRSGSRSTTAITSAQQEAAARSAARAAQLAALPPLVLRPQLYSVLRDRTSADREVERLRASGRVRVLRFPGAGPGADEDALMAEADYRACVAAAREAAETAAAEAKRGREMQQEASASEDAEARLWSLRAFEARVVPSAEGRAPAPRRAAVLALLAQYDGGGEAGSFPIHRPPTPDAMLTHLMAAGVLARDPSVAAAPSAAAAATAFGDEDEDDGAAGGAGGRGGRQQNYGQGPGGRAAQERRMQRSADAHATGASAAAALLLTLPGAGPIARSAPAGRAALLALLRSRPHGEMPEREVLRAGAGSGRGSSTSGGRLRGSVLPTAFHVRDAIGRGLVRRAEGVPGGGGAVLALVD